MSHFTVLVVGEDVEGQLQPFHEFECTGEDDQYVQDIDLTEKVREEYAENKVTVYRDPFGCLYRTYEDQFYRDPTREELDKIGLVGGTGFTDGLSFTSRDWDDGQGYRTKVKFKPFGYEEIQVPLSELEPFLKWLQDSYGYKIVPYGQEPDLQGDHKYGYVLVNESGEVEKIVDRSNPRKKWDWYQIGGRWNGFFKLKELSTEATGTIGEPGLQIINEDYQKPGLDRADQCLKGDIDFEGMRNEAAEKAGNKYDTFMDAVKDYPPILSWKQICSNFTTGEIGEDGEPVINYNAAREAYHTQPGVKALHQSENRDLIFAEPDDYVLHTREEYVDNARKEAVLTFAVVKDGNWYESGQMGWWNIVRDRMDESEWAQKFNELIDSLPDNTLFTVVDCHI